MPIFTRGHSSNGQTMSSCPSLLGATVAMGSFCPMLLCYHCSDVFIVMGRMSIAIVLMTYSYSGVM
jgi:hypothetical protein